MIVVLIRHGESMNNYLYEKDPITYPQLRCEDPTISERGEKEMKALGRYLKEKEITFDRYFCSPFHRALLSTKLLFEAMEKPTDNIEILIPIHEYGGCSLKGKGCLGKPRSFVCANLIV